MSVAVSPARRRVSRRDLTLTVFESSDSSTGAFSASDSLFSVSPNVDIFSEQEEQRSTSLQVETHTANYTHNSSGGTQGGLTSLGLCVLDFFFCGLKSKSDSIKCRLKKHIGKIMQAEHQRLTWRPISMSSVSSSVCPKVTTQHSGL